jgi:hypothetical protein
LFLFGITLSVNTPWGKGRRFVKYDGTVHAGYAVEQLVEALRYKPEGFGFDSSWGHWDFSLT